MKRAIGEHSCQLLCCKSSNIVCPGISPKGSECISILKKKANTNNQNIWFSPQNKKSKHCYFITFKERTWQPKYTLLKEVLSTQSTTTTTKLAGGTVTLFYGQQMKWILRWPSPPIQVPGKKEADVSPVRILRTSRHKGTRYRHVVDKTNKMSTVAIFILYYIYIIYKYL